MESTGATATDHKIEVTRDRLKQKMKALAEASEQAVEEAVNDHDEAAKKAISAKQMESEMSQKLEDARKRVSESPNSPIAKADEAIAVREHGKALSKLQQLDTEAKDKATTLEDAELDQVHYTFV